MPQLCMFRRIENWEENIVRTEMGALPQLSKRLSWSLFTDSPLPCRILTTLTSSSSNSRSSTDLISSPSRDGGSGGATVGVHWRSLLRSPWLVIPTRGLKISGSSVSYWENYQLIVLAFEFLSLVIIVIYLFMFCSWELEMSLKRKVGFNNYVQEIYNFVFSFQFFWLNL